jgi:hypothetical protein
MERKPPILFLDIDGVLNDHTWHQPADSTTIDKPCMNWLNKNIAETDCDIVISSAWRYLILGRAMTSLGFYQMLRTHGLDKNACIVGLTHSDEVRNIDGVFASQESNRGQQIQSWLDMYGFGRPYCVVDDRDDLGIRELHGDAFVKTDPNLGMTYDDMKIIVEKLGRK